MSEPTERRARTLFTTHHGVMSTTAGAGAFDTDQLELSVYWINLMMMMTIDDGNRIPTWKNPTTVTKVLRPHLLRIGG